MEAVTGRVLKLENRLVLPQSIEEKLRLKDLRKRSLNFHKFVTEIPFETEVAIRALNDVERTRWLRRLPILKITQLIQNPANPSFEILQSEISSLRGTISKHFREISPALYSDFARLIGSRIDFQNPSQGDLDFLDMFLRGVIKSADDTSYSIFQLATALGYCRKRAIPDCLKTRRRFLDLVSDDSANASAIIEYLSLCSPDHLDDVDFRLLRILMRQTVIQLTKKRKSVSNLQNRFLERIGLVNEDQSPADCVSMIQTIGRFTSHLHIPRKLYDGIVWFVGNDCDISLYDRMSLVAPFVNDPSNAQLLRSLLYQYFRSAKNLSFVPRKELEHIATYCRLVGFEHPYYLRRLSRSLPDFSLSRSSFARDHQLNSNEQFLTLINLLKFPRAHDMRILRRRMHELMNSIKIGRLSSDIVHEQLIPHDGCRICESFGSRLELARKFHI